MKQAVLTDKKEFTVQDNEMFVNDGTKVLTKVAYAGVCGSDLHYWVAGDTWANGWILGHEFTGVIEDPGPREDLKSGDKVVVLPAYSCGECYNCTHGKSQACQNMPLNTIMGIGVPGGYSEYVLTDSRFPLKLADHIGLDEATLIEPCTVGECASRKAKLQEDESVLVIGAGIIGLITAMWMKKRGAKKLTIVELGDDRLEFARKTGIADVVIDGKDDDFMEQILAANGGEQYPVLVECVGIGPTLNGYLDAIKPAGRMIVMGVPNDMIPFNFNNVITRNIELIPSHGADLEAWYTSIEALEKGEINLKQFITAVKPLDEVQSVFEDLTSGHTKNIKVLLKP